MTSVDQTAQVGLLARACASTRSILENVTREQLALPTPCSDWPVHDLIAHIVGATDFFADVAEHGSSPEGREWPSYSDGDFIASFGQQAGRVLAVLSAPGTMERIMVLPTGPPPGSRCIQVATGEIFIHGWDLAKATGQAMPPDEGVAGALLSSPWASLCAEVRNGDPSVFAPGDSRSGRGACRRPAGRIPRARPERARRAVAEGRQRPRSDYRSPTSEESAVLEMRPTCERCATALPVDGDARICSYECTFCPTCTEEMSGRCPNCGGELLPRPRRTLTDPSVA